MGTVEYVVLLDEGVRKRHFHRSEKGEVEEFVVQLEVLRGNKWRSVIRYDCSHAYTHVDRYFPDGGKKKFSLGLGFNEALILADEDVRENWGKYIEEFRRRH